jgi:hypothetical protein
MYLKLTGYEIVDWIKVAQERESDELYITW